MKISVGPLELNLKDLGNLDRKGLEEFREKLKAAGAPELLSDELWRSGRSSIPRRTGRSISHVPPSAGFAKNRPPSTRTAKKGAKYYESPKKFKVEKDELLDEEFQKIPELDEVFRDCLKSFPEVKDVEIRATKSDELMGMKGRLNGRSVVILFVPEQIWGKWQALKPIIEHELCHFVDLENPERVFEKRADKKSKELWHKLKKMGLVKCKVERRSK